MSDNLSCVLTANRQLTMRNWPIAEPASDEIQMKVQCVGICGSDVHYWKSGGVGNFRVQEDMVLGHEAAGIVTRVGDLVTHLKVGDRVAIEPSVPCHLCHYCKIGRSNLCPNCKCHRKNGCMAEYHNHTALNCHKIPDTMSMEEGALLEPLSVSLHACRRAGIKLGNTVLISGAGPIGLLCMLTAKCMGAGQICMTDISQLRLDFAKSLGDVSTVLAGDKQATLAKVCEELGDLADVTLECSGAEPALQLAIQATRSGGTMTPVGLGTKPVTLPIVEACMREVDIRGAFRYMDTYPTAIYMVNSGQADVKRLVTHRFRLDQGVEAMEMAASGNAVKVVVNCA